MRLCRKSASDGARSENRNLAEGAEEAEEVEEIEDAPEK
jgi:hypothetical protein